MNILRVKTQDGTIADLPFGVGAKGGDGKSAYEYAKDGGYTGTEAEFAEKLAQKIPTKVSELANDQHYIKREQNLTMVGVDKNGSKHTYTLYGKETSNDPE